MRFNLVSARKSAPYISHHIECDLRRHCRQSIKFDKVKWQPPKAFSKNTKIACNNFFFGIYGCGHRIRINAQKQRQRPINVVFNKNTFGSYLKFYYIKCTAHVPFSHLRTYIRNSATSRSSRQTIYTMALRHSTAICRQRTNERNDDDDDGDQDDDRCVQSVCAVFARVSKSLKKKITTFFSFFLTFG